MQSTPPPISTRILSSSSACNTFLHPPFRHVSWVHAPLSDTFLEFTSPLRHVSWVHAPPPLCDTGLSSCPHLRHVSWVHTTSFATHILSTRPPPPPPLQHVSCIHAPPLHHVSWVHAPPPLRHVSCVHAPLATRTLSSSPPLRHVSWVHDPPPLARFLSILPVINWRCFHGDVLSNSGTFRFWGRFDFRTLRRTQRRQIGQFQHAFIYQSSLGRYCKVSSSSSSRESATPVNPALSHCWLKQNTHGMWPKTN